MHGILASIISGSWFIDEQSAQGYLPVAASFLKGEHNPFVENLAENREKNKPYFIEIAAEPRYIGDYGVDSVNELPENSIAIIPIHGVITNDDQFSGPSGSRTKMQMIEKIGKSDKVVGVIFDFDTPGGEAAGTRQLSRRIASMDKPNVAYVRNMLASAGYWIAAASDYIILEDKLSRVGSIGGYMTLADQTRYFENQGVDITKVYARQSTKKNRAVTRDNNTENELQDISQLTQVFIDDITEYRGDKLADDPDILAGEIYWGNTAIEKGLADAFGTFATAVSYINTSISGTQSNLNNMKIKDTWKNVKAFFGTDKEELHEEDVEKLNTELGSKDEQINNLTSEKQKLEDEKKALGDEKKKLEDEKKALEDEKKQLEADKAEAEKKLAEKPAGSTAKLDKEQDGNKEEDNEIPTDPADEELSEMY